MIYLLDTNACIRWLNVAPSSVKDRIRRMTLTQLATCDVVKGELWYGAYRSERRAENMAALERFFLDLVSYPFDSPASRAFGEIRANLARRGTPIGPYDLQIAAITQVHGLTLVTHNTAEFTRVRGLKLEDWEA